MHIFFPLSAPMQVQGVPSSEAGPPGPPAVQPGSVPGRGDEERRLLLWNVQSLLQAWEGQLLYLKPLSRWILSYMPICAIYV